MDRWLRREIAGPPRTDAKLVKRADSDVLRILDWIGGE